MKGFLRLRDKIIISVALYLTVIGIAGNIFLYAYLLRTVSAKAERLDRTYLESVKARLDRDFSALFSLAVICANDSEIIRAVSRRDRLPQERIRDALEAQSRLKAYLQANPAGDWVNRIILAGGEDFYVQVTGRLTGDRDDLERLRSLPLYAAYMAGGGRWVAGFGPSLALLQSQWPDSYRIIFPLQGYQNTPEGFICLEAGLDMVNAVFREYSALPGLRALTGDGLLIGPEGKLEKDPFPPAQSSRYRREGRSYRLDLLPLESAGLLLRYEADVTELRQDDRDIFYTVLMVILGSLLAAAGLGLSLSFILTRPIRRIIGRIKKIGENDLSYDPEIERGRDELGQIGRALNEMTGSIARLLKEMEESFRQRRTTEIALLQTRINPHFLYNTLDSIQWMAKIQKNAGIADMTRSLINLLRNIIAGSGDLITVGEELRLLEDYTAVMSIRFMGIFRLENRIEPSLHPYLIPKLTLQPLVENSIIHGIAPSGVFGTITLEGRLEAAPGEPAFLVLIVTDTGQGIGEERLGDILKAEPGKSGASLNTIGLGNVDERLRLLYGAGAGLSFEGGEGRGLRVTVRLGARRAQSSEVAPPPGIGQAGQKEGDRAPGTAG